MDESSDDMLAVIVDIVLALTIMFLLPFGIFSLQEERLMLREARKLSSEFVDQVSKNGYISEEMYRNYIKKLGYTGRSYNVELRHTRTDILDGETSRTETYSTEILDQIYERGAYLMNIGDEVSVSITEVTYTQARKFTWLLFRAKNSGYITKSGHVIGIAWDAYEAYF